MFDEPGNCVINAQLKMGDVFEFAINCRHNGTCTKFASADEGQLVCNQKNGLVRKNYLIPDCAVSLSRDGVQLHKGILRSRCIRCSGRLKGPQQCCGQNDYAPHVVSKVCLLVLILDDNHRMTGLFLRSLRNFGLDATSALSRRCRRSVMTTIVYHPTWYKILLLSVWGKVSQFGMQVLPSAVRVQSVRRPRTLRPAPGRRSPRRRVEAYATACRRVLPGTAPASLIPGRCRLRLTRHL